MQNLTRYETKPMIKEMVFVTNEHIMVQFLPSFSKPTQDEVTASERDNRMYQTVVFNLNGKVVVQPEEV